MSHFDKAKKTIVDRLERSNFLTKSQLRSGVQDLDQRLPWEAALRDLQVTGVVTELFDMRRTTTPGYHPGLYVLTSRLNGDNTEPGSMSALPDGVITYEMLISMFKIEV